MFVLAVGMMMMFATTMIQIIARGKVRTLIIV